MGGILVPAVIGLGSGLLGAGIVVLALRKGRVSTRGTEADLTVVKHRSVDDTTVTAAIETVLQRQLGPSIANLTTIVVPLPSEDIKGKLIGREGRNIRAFEDLTGVDLVIDETPEAVVLSSFEARRRYVAYLTLTNLVLDGRIHPARIEEVYRECAESLDEYLIGHATSLLASMGLEPEREDLVAASRMLLLQSDGVNQFEQALEVARLAGDLALELELNPVQARSLGVLRALPGDFERESEFSAAESAVVSLAQEICSARPGSKRIALGEQADRYSDIEHFLVQQPEVERALVMRAGKEIRVTVTSSTLFDESLTESLAGRLKKNFRFVDGLQLTVLQKTERSSKIS